MLLFYKKTDNVYITKGESMAKNEREGKKT